jgi:glutathione synthase
MALQLAGAKKVQQELAKEGVLEDFLLGDRPDVGGQVSQKDVDAVRETWTGLWPLDDTPLGREALNLARTQPERFVLKPQREGGGNNIYRTDIPSYLDKLDAEPCAPGDPPKREAYILMELITPPEGVHNWLVRGGEGKARLADVVSELGVYGVSLFGGKNTVNRLAGTLLRTKGRESDEGGVAIGKLGDNQISSTG